MDKAKKEFCFLRKGIFWVFLFYLSTLSLHNWSQTPHFTALKIDKTLQQFETQCIFQDSKGYIWFATSNGLYRHDGSETIKFGVADSLSNSPVTAISEDTNSTIWVGHKSGEMELYNGHLFNDFKPEEGLPMAEITFITFDTRGILWLGTQGEGIYYFTGEHRKRLYNLSTQEGLNDNYAYTAVQCPYGDMYVGTDNGISVIETATNRVKKTLTMRDGLPDNIVKHLEIKGNILWIGMDEGGIAMYDIGLANFLPHFIWEFGRINNFTLRSDNECWVSTKSRGVIKLNFNANYAVDSKPFTIQHGLKSNKTSIIYADRERNIWIGNTLSIVKTSASPFEFLDQRDGFEHQNLFSFINDSHGRFWAATENGLIRVCKDGSGGFESKTFNPPQEIAKSSFITIYEDKEGYIWAGTYGYGAFRINPEKLTFQHFTIENGLPDNNIMHITGNGNSLWFSTLGGGIGKFDIAEKTFSSISTEQGLGSNYVYSIFVDSVGRVFASLDGGGISVIENGAITAKFLPDSLGIRTVYAVVVDKNRNIWFSSAEKGLCRLNGVNFIQYTQNEGYSITNLRSIISDNSGNIVAVGNEAVQIYVTESGTFETYSEESGVAFLNPNLNAISKDQNGNIWISTQNGLTVYYPEVAASNTVLPKVLISKKMLFFEPIDSGDTKFNFRQNHLSFEFAGFWHQSPEHLLYRYKLQNYDYDWSRPTQTRNVTYSNLPPGNYTFYLEVSHKPGIWTGSEQAIYGFSISPPFYKTWWFIALSLLIIGSSIVYYVKARISKLQKDKEQLENEVLKRTATILHQKEEIETQRDYVIKQRDQIAKQNKNITSSIQYASRIQNALFQPFDQMQSILGDCFVLWRPQDIVSGDFYWATTKGDDVLLAVADCTGHGVPGAFMSVLGMSLLNKTISSNPSCCQPHEIFNTLRDEVKVALRQTGKVDEAKDGMDMAMVIYNRSKLTLHFVGANNPAFIVRDSELITLSENRMPIGIYPKEHDFTSQNVDLHKGDMLYLFSDGYTDQFGGPDERKFMMKKFKQLLVSVSQKTTDEQYQILNSTMDEWKQGSEQNDDILVVGIRF